MRTTKHTMSNYPPGTSAGDPRAPWNAPDHSHKHEWIPAEKANPIFEDGAAIFHDYCEYVEGRYRDGWSCEETRRFRCDVERVVLVRESEPDISYLASEEDSINEWGFIERLFELALIAVENAARSKDLKVEQVDPANKHGDGYVRVSVGDYQVVYSQY